VISKEIMMAIWNLSITVLRFNISAESVLEIYVFCWIQIDMGLILKGWLVKSYIYSFNNTVHENSNRAAKTILPKKLVSKVVEMYSWGLLFYWYCLLDWYWCYIMYMYYSLCTSLSFTFLVVFTEWWQIKTTSVNVKTGFDNFTLSEYN